MQQQLLATSYKKYMLTYANLSQLPTQNIPIFT